ncbi:hypothetical protein NDU88_005227 [Pleurodeles waltl]|uniref:Secreted protein n=1 Tax=Pleurodeles waltl TaxID=8319 RepID=A0AAV7TAQ8_PLEWA|nr:hypothetical protein NDU88_005227 [Pleurodeles waltl]
MRPLCLGGRLGQVGSLRCCLPQALFVCPALSYLTPHWQLVCFPCCPVLLWRSLYALSIYRWPVRGKSMSGCRRRVSHWLTSLSLAAVTIAGDLVRASTTGGGRLGALLPLLSQAKGRLSISDLSVAPLPLTRLIHRQRSKRDTRAERKKDSSVFFQLLPELLNLFFTKLPTANVC